MREIRGAIFDVDGLLFNTEQLYCDICIELAPQYGIENYNQDYYKKYVGTSNKALYEIYQNDFPFLSIEDVSNFIRAVQKIAESYLEVGNVEIKAGTKEILEFFYSQNIPCVIASNNQTKFIESMLDHHNLDIYFQKIYSFDDVENPKPHPEMVNKAVNFLGIDKKSLVMFEDSSHGAIAAITANVPVIIVPDMLPVSEEIRGNVLKECESLLDAKEFLSTTHLFR
ncbi:HAD family hydrolase [Wohlfahrtiimonas larvae]|uniref:HAD family hydrolase n=1 Tax=Wohlfahrtiimonas larvae TaxID=1157986 RepID=A0ABP9MDL4_9GAMM|nr:HAD hydrolase-like protein [Wohlfahrtiimonas larvae]